VLIVVVLLGAGTIFLLANVFKGGSSDQNPYSPQTGTLVLNDPIQDNSKGYKWDEETLPGSNGATSSCAFSGGAYHMSANAQGLWIYCNPEAPNLVFTNVAFEAKMTVIAGDAAGVGVRLDQKQNTGYLFIVHTQGNYVLEALNANAPTDAQRYIILRQGTDASIKQGLNQTNLIALVANGTTLSGYVNNQLVATAQDSTYSSGQIGVYDEGDNQASDTIASDARAWKI
jgi:hypothetical protein